MSHTPIAFRPRFCIEPNLCGNTHVLATGGKTGRPGTHPKKRSAVPHQLVEEIYKAYFG